MKIKFIVFRMPNEKINYKLLKFLKTKKINFFYLNLGKNKMKSKRIKIVNYKDQFLKELFIRILSQKEDLCFFIHNEFNSLKDIGYLIKKSKWYFQKYHNEAGILDFNLTFSKYFYFSDKLVNNNKFYGLNMITCPDPRCFVVKRDVLSNFMDFEIITKNFGRGFEIFLAFFCYYNKLLVCRDISKKIKLKFDSDKFKTLLATSLKNTKYEKKLNIFIENISASVYFNYETNGNVYYNKGPKKLLGFLRPILNKKFLFQNKPNPYDCEIKFDET